MKEPSTKYFGTFSITEAKLHFKESFINLFSCLSLSLYYVSFLGCQRELLYRSESLLSREKQIISEVSILFLVNAKN